MNTQERLTKLIVEQFGVKEAEVVPTADIVDDLGADSLDSIELVMAIEEEFDIEISDEEAEKLTTVGSVLDYLNAHVPPTIRPTAVVSL